MTEGRHPRPTQAEATRAWARIALLSFGGPAGQIAVMHRILVEEKRWLDAARFLHALNFCMLLPGPEAQQLATYVGWLLHGPRGGLIAGALFILPGAVAIMVLSWLYVLYGEIGAVAAAFVGLKAAVLAIVLQALMRLASRTLLTQGLRATAALAFLGIFVFGVPFPLIVICAGLAGYLAARLGPSGARADTQPGAGHERVSRPVRRAAFRAGIVALLLWLVPVFLLLAFAGRGNVFTEIALFFSRMAMVTFGGAYAALAYVAQAAVDTHGWLTPGEMLDGLGMAETTPGPLVMVLQFVGFLAAYREAGWAVPLLAATLGGMLATWVTFAPCFAWIFLAAPFLEDLRGNLRLAAALRAVTAAVVGVILNLAVWFAIHVLFDGVVRIDAGPLHLDLPRLATLDWASAGLVGLAFVAVFGLRLGIVPVLALNAALGLLLALL